MVPPGLCGAQFESRARRLSWASASSSVKWAAGLPCKQHHVDRAWLSVGFMNRSSNENYSRGLEGDFLASLCCCHGHQNWLPKAEHICIYIFCFLGLHSQHMAVPGLGVQLAPPPQPPKTQAVSVTYTSTHGNARSLTH